MDAAWSSFLFQTPPTQTQGAGPLHSELLPGLDGPPQTPPSAHMAPPPSTVDTAALSEDPEPVKPLRHAGLHICSICSKQFKNGYNLRRHQSVHTGARRQPRDPERGAGGSGGPGGPAPVSLLQLAAPPPPPPPPPALLPPSLGNGHGDGAAALLMPAATGTAIAMATTTQPLPGATGQEACVGDRRVRRSHACEACGKAFRDVYHLNRHRLSHSDEKPFSCPVCQQRFKRKDRMAYHVRSHQGGVEKPYVCPHCSKGFSRPDHLNSHVRQVHSTERPFKCETCESAFATRDRLRAHMIRHEDKVPCHVCGKLLSAAYISDHMRVHNQAQHHVCELCSRGFTTLAYLRVHAQKHHGQDWRELGALRGSGGAGGVGGVLLCQLCGVHCKTATQLQGHMEVHANAGVSDGAASANAAALASAIASVSTAIAGAHPAEPLVPSVASSLTAGRS